MRPLTRFVLPLMLLVLMALPAMAQQRDTTRATVSNTTLCLMHVDAIQNNDVKARVDIPANQTASILLKRVDPAQTLQLKVRTLGCPEGENYTVETDHVPTDPDVVLTAQLYPTSSLSYIGAKRRSGT